MRTVTKGYMLLIGALGTIVSIGSVWRLFFLRPEPWSLQELGAFSALLILSWVCYCLPLYIRDDCTVDLSFISILASVLSLGPDAAIVISLISYPLSIIPAPDGKSYIHLFNTAPIKTVFNISNRSISYAVGGLAYYALGGVPGNISLPGVLLPAAAYIVLSMAANVAVIVLYYMFSQNMKPFPTAFEMFWGLVPSIALSSPIGYFLALLLGMHNGAWLAVLFMLPLLLARYSFKLYLDGQRQQYSIVGAFAAALEAKDTYTQGHSSRVAAYARQIAQVMRLPERRAQRLYDAAVFHDIGKIGVPDAVLQKPGDLTEEERAIIQRHPQKGVDILQKLDSYRDLLPLILHHHEFYDGNGYPEGTRGDQVPLEVYILGAADAFDAITSHRPYRRGRPALEAARILREEAGKQFHPEVAEVVAGMIERGELVPPAEETPEEAGQC